jgi:hypothetical protein
VQCNKQGCWLAGWLAEWMVDDQWLQAFYLAKAPSLVTYEWRCAASDLAVLVAPCAIHDALSFDLADTSPAA